MKNFGDMEWADAVDEADRSHKQKCSLLIVKSISHLRISTQLNDQTRSHQKLFYAKTATAWVVNEFRVIRTVETEVRSIRFMR
jgi:hypothetical protein